MYLLVHVSYGFNNHRFDTPLIISNDTDKLKQYIFDKIQNDELDYGEIHEYSEYSQFVEVLNGSGKTHYQITIVKEI